MKDKFQKGFTLVEMAIVLVIVGLLAAGILKGQEIIRNSQITSTITDMEEYVTATNTFVQIYGVFPGDMANANYRLLDCNAAPCGNGNGDGAINVNVGVANLSTNESGFYFNQLRAAGFISGFDGTNVAEFGRAFPTTPAGGGYMVGDTDGGGTITGFTLTEMRPGAYLLITDRIADVGVGTGILDPQQAARIDRTIDDGEPNRGRILAQTLVGQCRSAVNIYAESENRQTCVIAYALP